MAQSDLNGPRVFGFAVGCWMWLATSYHLQFCFILRYSTSSCDMPLGLRDAASPLVVPRRKCIILSARTGQQPIIIVAGV